MKLVSCGLPVGGILAKTNREDREGVSPIQKQLRLQRTLKLTLVATYTLPCRYHSVLYSDSTTVPAVQRGVLR